MIVSNKTQLQNQEGDSPSGLFIVPHNIIWLFLMARPCRERSLISVLFTMSSANALSVDRSIILLYAV